MPSDRTPSQAEIEAAARRFGFRVPLSQRDEAHWREVLSAAATARPAPLERVRELLAIEGHGMAYFDVLPLVRELLGVEKPAPSRNVPMSDAERERLNDKADRAIAWCKEQGRWKMPERASMGEGEGER